MLQDTHSSLAYWRNARSRTVRVLEALAPEDLEWAPAPGAFTFGDLFRHLAGLERFMYAENVQGRPSTYPGHKSDLASGLDGVRAYLDRCHAESLAIFATLSDADLLAPCVLRLTCPPPEGTPAPSSQSRSLPAGAQMATWKWLRAMAEHEAHHRGQLYLMASLRGHPVAPLFGLTEAQLAAASQAKS